MKQTAEASSHHRLADFASWVPGCQIRLGETTMGMTYYKRYRMEIDLRRWVAHLPQLEPTYRFLTWEDRLLETHADTKFRSFRFEIDANVFPCLGDRDGCLRLMREIARRDGFLPQATWLIAYQPEYLDRPEYCGTIQGIQDRHAMGSIQNIGVTPEHRSRGLGSGLVFHALQGFRQVGLERAFLEVTAQNVGAVRLYRRLGFRTVRTVYKSAEVAYA
jgi:ribosomal protein S18 acetylase RimI-like enzyme